MLDLTLRFNRLLDFITKRLRPPLHISTNHFLVTLLARGEATAGSLVPELGLEKSTVSRLVARLTKEGLITSRPSPRDAREKLLSLTPAGQKVLLEDLKVRDQQVEESVAALTPEERDQFTRLLRKFADAFEAPDAEAPLPEAPLKVQLRRLTRSLGFLGENFLGTGVSIEQLQALHIAATAPNGLTVAALTRELPYERTLAYRRVKSLLSSALLKSAAGSRDESTTILSLSDRGQHTLSAALGAALQTLGQRIAHIPLKELDGLITLLNKCVSKVQSADSKGGSLEVRELSSEALRGKARALLVHAAVRLRCAGKLPHSLFAPESRSFGLWSNNKLVAALEIVPGKDGLVITNVVLSGRGPGDRLRCEVARTIINRVREEQLGNDASLRLLPGVQEWLVPLLADELRVHLDTA